MKQIKHTIFEIIKFSSFLNLQNYENPVLTKYFLYICSDYLLFIIILSEELSFKRV